MRTGLINCLPPPPFKNFWIRHWPEVAKTWKQTLIRTLCSSGGQEVGMFWCSADGRRLRRFGTSAASALVVTWRRRCGGAAGTDCPSSASVTAPIDQLSTGADGHTARSRPRRSTVTSTTRRPRTPVEIARLRVVNVHPLSAAIFSHIQMKTYNTSHSPRVVS